MAEDAAPDFFYERIGARVRLARRAQKLSTYELAEKAGLPQSTVSEIENGTLSPLGIGRLRKVTTALGLPIAKFLDDEVEMPAQAKPPKPLDPNYVTDPAEQRLLAAWRDLVGKEQRIVMLLAQGIPTARDRRVEPRARKRVRFNWNRPGTKPDPLSPKETPANGKWLNENAANYHGQYVALRMGKLIDSDRQRPVLLSRLVGQEGILIVSLLDLDHPRLERWPPKQATLADG